MKTKGPTILPLAPVHLVGLGLFQAAIALCVVDPRLAAIPLALFLLVVGIAPFFPGSALLLPALTRGPRTGTAVALTFDDGPDPATTPLLLALLARHGVNATFFVAGNRAEKHPELIRALVEAGHAVGNHSYTHDPLLMLRSTATLDREVSLAQQVLAGMGITPLAFRPPVGVVNPRLWRVLLRHGMYCLCFNRRAADFGNRRIQGLADRILGKARAGDIILLHDTTPAGAPVGALLDEVERLLAGLCDRGLAVIPLERLISRPVMRLAGDAAAPNAAGTFYDGLAAGYDDEQERAASSPARTAERALFDHECAGILRPSHRVLEIGAGTGRFTLDTARRVAGVVAVDVSAEMIDRLRRTAAAQGIATVQAVQGDFETLGFDGEFDVVCSFSAFEYMPDLAAVLGKIHELLKPGGVLYVVTSHRSFPRFWIQVGNAMRQGLWLHARGAGEMRRLLRNAGFREIQITRHGLAPRVSGGILLKVLARK